MLSQQLLWSLILKQDRCGPNWVSVIVEGVRVPMLWSSIVTPSRPHHLILNRQPPLIRQPSTTPPQLRQLPPAQPPPTRHPPSFVNYYCVNYRRPVHDYSVRHRSTNRCTDSSQRCPVSSYCFNYPRHFYYAAGDCSCAVVRVREALSLPPRHSYFITDYYRPR